MSTVQPLQKAITTEQPIEIGSQGKYSYICYDFTSSLIDHLEKTPSNCETTISKVLALALPIIALLELIIMVVLLPLTFIANQFVQAVETENTTSESPKEDPAQDEIILGTEDVPEAPPLNTIVIGDTAPAPPPMDLPALEKLLGKEESLSPKAAAPIDAPNPPPMPPPMAPTGFPGKAPFLGAIGKQPFKFLRKKPEDIQLSTAGFGIRPATLDAKKLNREIGEIAKKLKPVKERQLPPPAALNPLDLITSEIKNKAHKLRVTPRPVHNRANTAPLGTLAAALAGNPRFQQLTAEVEVEEVEVAETWD